MKMMVEMREMYIALAAERAKNRAQAELAVALVMAALSRAMHDGSRSDEPIAEQLKATVHLLLAASADELQPARPAL
jgi:hypothetical protein